MRGYLAHLLVSATLMAATAASLAQDADDRGLSRARASADTLMSEVRDHRALSVDWQRQIEPALRSEPALLDAHLADRSERVRERALAMLGTMALRASETSTRRAVVERLVAAAEDPEPMVYQRAERLLERFDSKDYSDDAKAALREVYRAQSRRSRLIKAVGAAGLADLADELAVVAAELDYGDKRWLYSPAWAATLARARFGLPGDTEAVVQRANGWADRHRLFTRLSYDLAYVRQPQTLEVLRKLLDSNEMTPNLHGAGRLPLNDYVMDALATVFNDFPVARKSPGRYTKDDKKAARRYLRRWGTIKR